MRDLLEEYAARSHGKIILEEIDPEPFTPAEDEASADGLSGAPTDSGDNRLFRSRRHQYDRRQGSHSVFLAGSRALSRIRRDVADLSPVDAEEAGARDHLEPAARHRRRRHGRDDAGPVAAVHDLRRAQSDLRDENARSEFRSHSGRRRRADDRPSGPADPGADLRHRPVRARGRPCARVRRPDVGDVRRGAIDGRRRLGAAVVRSAAIVPRLGHRLRPEQGRRRPPAGAGRAGAGAAAAIPSRAIRSGFISTRPISTPRTRSRPTCRCSISPAWARFARRRRRHDEFPAACDVVEPGRPDRFRRSEDEHASPRI